MAHHDGGHGAAHPFPLLGIGAGEDEVIWEGTDALEFGNAEFALFGWVDD